MDNKIFSKLSMVAGLLALPVAFALQSCVDEPDENDASLYTFTGETIADYLGSNEEFSSFYYILQRSGYDRLMSTYGEYTCFAPTNDAVADYIDSLYNAENELFEHNGMTENSLEGLTDSLCTDIAEFHLARTKISYTDISDGSTINTFLGRTFTASVVDNSYIVLNEVAQIVEYDTELTNGYVHMINNVIPRSNNLLGTEMENSGLYGIFCDAFELTGLNDVLNGATEKTTTFTTPSSTIGSSTSIESYYIPSSYTCKIGYTVFAVPDSVLNTLGIYTVEDLAAYANEKYGQCAEGSRSSESSGWYDYYRNNGAQVSTGTDYADSLNCLNMFMRYHIIKGAVASDLLTVNYMLASSYGVNFCYDYYETLLPKTLLKIWTPDVSNNNATYINRWEESNTLTDNVLTTGSSSMHTVRRVGSYVHRTSPLQPLNGYIYQIDEPLVYDYYVPQGVLNERMRFEITTCLHELSSNGYRGMDQPTAQALANNSSVVRMRYPSNYFDNVVTFNGSNTTLDMNFRAGSTGHDFILYQGDSFQGMGEFDLAIKLPPVPDREYELRIDVTLGDSYFGMMQFYIGDGPEQTGFSPIDIPIDFRMSSDDARLGLTDAREESDYGVETDQALRTRSWMRAPMCYARRTDDSSGGLGGVPARYAAYSVRRILYQDSFEQRDYWLRLKSVLSDEHKFQIDYVEFCPIDVVENSMYLEDVY